MTSLTAEQIDAERRKRAEELRHKFFAVDAGNSASPDNLICALASYFESCIDCPEEVPDENGWQPWAISQADLTIQNIVDIAIAFADERANAECLKLEQLLFDGMAVAYEPVGLVNEHGQVSPRHQFYKDAKAYFANKDAAIRARKGKS